MGSLQISELNVTLRKSVRNWRTGERIGDPFSFARRLACTERTFLQRRQSVRNSRYPKQASGRDVGCMSRFVQPAKALLEHDPDPDADLLAMRRNRADLMVSSACSKR